MKNNNNFLTKKYYYIFNKPSGCVTARNDKDNKTVMDYFYDKINTSKTLTKEIVDSLFPIGRLDKDTEGLLIITNDGEFCNYIMQPENKVPKKYMFWAMGSLDKEDIEKIEIGIDVSRQSKTENCINNKCGKIEIIHQGLYEEYKQHICGENHKNVNKKPNQMVVCGYLTITDGCKHQVKRMLKAAGCYVIYLKRVSIGKITLIDNLCEGEFINISYEDISNI